MTIRRLDGVLVTGGATPGVTQVTLGLDLAPWVGRLDYRYLSPLSGEIAWTTGAPRGVTLNGVAVGGAVPDMFLTDVTWGAGRVSTVLAVDLGARGRVLVTLDGPDLPLVDTTGGGALLSEWRELLRRETQVAPDSPFAPGASIRLASLLAPDLGPAQTGDAGADRLNGGARADVLVGRAGDDRLEGGAGADTLLCGAGDDRAFGGRGADVLAGFAGDDVLSGGAGGDIFQFAASRRLGQTFGDDRITDLGRDDRILFNATLWGAVPLTNDQVVDQFAAVTDAGVLFDFGAAGTLLVAGLGRLTGLEGQIIQGWPDL